MSDFTTFSAQDVKVLTGMTFTIEAGTSVGVAVPLACDMRPFLLGQFSTSTDGPGLERQ